MEFDRAFAIRAVSYVIPNTAVLSGIRDKKERSLRIRKDLELIQQNGNARVMVYSNQKKVALYVGGWRM